MVHFFLHKKINVKMYHYSLTIRLPIHMNYCLFIVISHVHILQ